MIDLKTLRELVKLMVSNDLTEMDLQDQGERVSLKRGGGEPQVHYTPAPAVVHHAQPQTAAAAVPVAAAAAPAGTPAATANDGLTPVTSPMVGTFYASPSPDSKPFAAVGDRITPDTVVCIIEAMKVFNEIKAEQGGTIEKILATSGQAVEFGQPLFLIKPA
jgi:acetyl-CoA carboxylase biotin carboxyl carrier protein